MDRGKEDCKQAAQANRLTLVLGQKGGSRVWQPLVYVDGLVV